MSSFQTFFADRKFTSKTLGSPKSVSQLDVVSPVLRLMAGADAGDGATYGYQEISIKRGKKRCSIYEIKEHGDVIVDVIVLENIDQALTQQDCDEIKALMKEAISAEEQEQ
jgi:hypothetical protein